LQPIFVIGSLECEETSFSAGSSVDLAEVPRAASCQPLRHPDCDQWSAAAGILMGARKVARTSKAAGDGSNWLQPKVLRHSRSDLSLSERSPSRRTPEITVHAPEERLKPLKENMRIDIRTASSERDISLNLSSSQSESALRSVRGFGSVLSSPSGNNALSRCDTFYLS